MPTLTLTVSQDWVDRADAWLRFGDQPWEGEDADTRGTAEMFKRFIGSLVATRIDIYEGNLQAEQRVQVDQPT